MLEVDQGAGPRNQLRRRGSETETVWGVERATNGAMMSRCSPWTIRIQSSRVTCDVRCGSPYSGRKRWFNYSLTLVLDDALPLGVISFHGNRDTFLVTLYFR